MKLRNPHSSWHFTIRIEPPRMRSRRQSASGANSSPHNIRQRRRHGLQEKAPVSIENYASDLFPEIFARIRSRIFLSHLRVLAAVTRVNIFSTATPIAETK